MYPGDYYIYSFCTLYFEFYSAVLLILLFSATVFKGNFKTESFNILYVVNFFVAWVSLYNLIYLAMELFLAWYGHNSYEWYVFGPSMIVSFEWYILRMFLSAFMGVLFFNRKLRSSRLFSLFFLIQINLAFIWDMYYYLMKDHLYSFFQTDNQLPVVVKVIQAASIILLLALIYLRSNKRNKLPYPSVLLK